ncbi:MAG: hypothetical protein GY754_31020 [bacterium]|nr:hypothetical protein [bacterium]
MSLSGFRSLKWTDFFLYALVSPRKLYRQIEKNDPAPFLLSFFVPAFLVFVELVTLATLLPGIYRVMFYGWIIGLLLLLLQVVVGSSLMDLTAQFFGYEGKGKEVIALFNFALFPKIFLLPLVYMAAVIDFHTVFFYIVFSIGLFIWSAFIIIEGISEMHSAEFGKSLLIFLFPILFIGIIMAVIGSVTVMSVLEQILA